MCSGICTYVRIHSCTIRHSREADNPSGLIFSIKNWNRRRQRAPNSTELIWYEENTERKNGKKKKYKIGTTLIVDNYILTALTKFNEKNEAYLSMNEYLSFLNIFWNEINHIHNGRVINVPVLGTGISRINPALSEQEFLEQIVLSLKTSELITSKSKINIIIYRGNKEKISLVKIKDKF